MGLYATYLLPRLINLAMQSKEVMAERAKLVPLASGMVLEVGVGSGLNIPLYTRSVEKLHALDPSPEMWRLARVRAARAPFPLEYLPFSGETIPAGDQTFDTVVTTWTLCTIPDPQKALTEMKRVLKPHGRLIFIEHGRAPDAGVRVWQDRLNPLQKRLAGGCNLNRQVGALIPDAGFRITRLETGYMRGPRPFTFLYKGIAEPG